MISPRRRYPHCGTCLIGSGFFAEGAALPPPGTSIVVTDRSSPPAEMGVRRDRTGMPSRWNARCKRRHRGSAAAEPGARHAKGVSERSRARWRRAPLSTCTASARTEGLKAGFHRNKVIGRITPEPILSTGKLRTMQGTTSFRFWTCPLCWEPEAGIYGP